MCIAEFGIKLLSQFDMPLNENNNKTKTKRKKPKKQPNVAVEVWENFYMELYLSSLALLRDHNRLCITSLTNDLHFIQIIWYKRNIIRRAIFYVDVTITTFQKTRWKL